MFILATQVFPESDRIALPFLGSLSDASLKVACFPDGCEEREECQCLSCLSEACRGSPAVTLEEVAVKMNSVFVGLLYSPLVFHVTAFEFSLLVSALYDKLNIIRSGVRVV